MALVNTGLDKQRVCLRCGPKLCICEDDMEEVYRLEPLELRMIRTCIK